MSEIESYISGQEDWKKANLLAFRELVHKIAPDIEEQWKWMVPVFLVNKKLVCAMSTFKGHTKFNFFEGALIDDQAGIFNNGLTSKKHRSIDMSESDHFNSGGIKVLLEQAVVLARSK